MINEEKHAGSARLDHQVALTGFCYKQLFHVVSAVKHPNPICSLKLTFIRCLKFEAGGSMTETKRAAQCRSLG